MNALEHISATLGAAVEFDEITPSEVREYIKKLTEAALEFGEEVNTEKMQRISAEIGRKFGHLMHGRL